MCCHLRPPDGRPFRTDNFWASGHQLLNFYGFIYIYYAAAPYSIGTVIMAIVYGRRVKTISLFFVIWHSFVEKKTVTK